MSYGNIVNLNLKELEYIIIQDYLSLSKIDEEKLLIDNQIETKVFKRIKESEKIAWIFTIDHDTSRFSSYIKDIKANDNNSSNKNIIIYENSQKMIFALGRISERISTLNLMLKVYFMSNKYSKDKFIDDETNIDYIFLNSNDLFFNIDMVFIKINKHRLRLLLNENDNSKSNSDHQSLYDNIVLKIYNDYIKKYGSLYSSYNYYTIKEFISNFKSTEIRRIVNSMNDIDKVEFRIFKELLFIIGKTYSNINFLYNYIHDYKLNSYYEFEFRFLFFNANGKAVLSKGLSHEEPNFDCENNIKSKCSRKNICIILYFR